MSTKPLHAVPRRTLCTVLLCLAGASRLTHGQRPSPAAWNLFSARYDTRTSDFIYAAYGYGDMFAMAGVLHNPRSDYSEVLLAAGRRFTVAGGPTQFAAAGMARAGDAWYAQLYFLPTLHRGAWWLRATSEFYLPVGATGTPQFALSPAAITFELVRRIEAGMSADVALARQAIPSTTVGPQLRFALPQATFAIDVHRGFGGQASRLRLSFLSAF
jgi:hypothetical protein